MICKLCHSPLTTSEYEWLWPDSLTMHIAIPSDLPDQGVSLLSCNQCLDYWLGVIKDTDQVYCELIKMETKTPHQALGILYRPASCQAQIIKQFHRLPMNWLLASPIHCFSASDLTPEIAQQWIHRLKTYLTFS